MTDSHALLAAPAARFPVPADADPAALAQSLGDCLERFEKNADDDPFSNPVLHLGLEISRRLTAGAVNYGALEQLVQHLSTEGVLDRAHRLRRWLGEVDPAANEAGLTRLISHVARPDDGAAPIPFADFAALVESEVYGFVVTAHPTFNLTGALMTDLACLATGLDEQGAPLGESGRAERTARIAASEHRPDRVIDLNREHELSLVAIGNMQQALRRVWDVVLQVAAEFYPDDWTRLTPRLATVASWVGYDLDGRSDIRWTDTLSKRLTAQQRQLRHYLGEVAAIAHSAAAAGREELGHTLDQIEARLALALREITDEIAVFDCPDPETPAAAQRIQELSRRMHDDFPWRLRDGAALTERINRAISLSAVDDGADDGAGAALVRRLCVLRAELAVFGLAMAHTHVRINATQMHNAIRRQVALDTAPDDPRYRQSYLERINELLESVQPDSINFGSLMGERTSAKRLFMIVAQMLKYADREAPVRFLIAETESAFTLLAALYFARRFGIEDRLDISPLFETGKALEVGSRIIDTVLENPHFRAYVQKRGRLCIQTGYSDAGRYLGQTPAAASIERLRNRVARLFAKHGLTGVQLVVFDTHGESIGRGAHPGGLTARLGYTCPPAWRALLAAEKIPFKQETSFQGGDGFLPFATEAAALAVVTRTLEYMLTPPPTAIDDPYYQEHDYITEFFSEVTTFQSGLVADPNYAMLVTAFGANLLFPSGSRSSKRQYDGAMDIDHLSVSQTRAIPHNAILQQLGLPANAIGGIGAAIDKDPRRYAALYDRSPRLRQLMGIVEYGAALTDTDALKAYVDTLDPGLWLTVAAHTTDGTLVRRLRAVAELLEDDPSHTRQLRVYRKLLRDYGLLREGLGLTGPGAGGLVPTTAYNALRLLHGVRLALIHETYRLATKVPAFSNQHQTSHKRVVSQLIHLDVPATVADLRVIFPATSGGAVDGDFGEPASYVSDESQGYAREHKQILQPLEDLHTLICRVGNAIVQRVGYLG